MKVKGFYVILRRSVATTKNLTKWLLDSHWKILRPDFQSGLRMTG